MSSSLPSREAELAPWLANFHDRVVAEAGHFGVPAAIVTTWTTAYTAFTAAYATATDPETRTRSAVAAKDTTKTEVLRQTRHIIGMIQSNPTVSDAQRVLLGLHVRDGEATPTLAPTEIPVAEVEEMNGWSVRMRLRSADSTRRGKPPLVTGANIYSYVGETPPADVGAWRHEGATSRATFEVAFDTALPAGTKVWIVCNWMNARFQTGPACAPVGLLIGGGLPTTLVG